MVFFLAINSIEFAEIILKDTNNNLILLNIFFQS